MSGMLSQTINTTTATTLCSRELQEATLELVMLLQGVQCSGPQARQIISKEARARPIGLNQLPHQHSSPMQMMLLVLKPALQLKHVEVHSQSSAR